MAVATPAAACLPPPPPNWEVWLGDSTVDMFLGRVELIETLATVEVDGVVITPGLAHIRRLEVIQGQPGETAQVGGALSVAYRADSAGVLPGTPPCIEYLSHKLGDLVVVVGEGSVFGRTVNDPAALVAYYEKHL
ncbi:hypothetical protein [Brevundimonas sp.]|uniref:hypothetical protein n=1 Tax=Brevundimonas sp. TaxID=1871086 RepID=UPI002ABB98AD|nr:hypothetical protein [Brevundimonas sp.]MDZ4365015.1 hypothetical protein [Brevundimonas sp.]